MWTRYTTLLLAAIAGFCGGTLSSRLLTVPSAKAAEMKTFDSLTTTHLVVSGDIVVQSTATRPLVLRDDKGNSLEFLYASPPVPGFFLAINNSKTARTNIPAVVLSENGVAFVQNAGDGITWGAQLSPQRLAMTHSDQSKVPWSTFSTTVNSNSVDVSFDDSKVSDTVHSTLSGEGFFYSGNGKKAQLPQ